MTRTIVLRDDPPRTGRCGHPVTRVLSRVPVMTPDGLRFPVIIICPVCDGTVS